VPTPLQVLYEDNHCLVVYKPAGLLTAGDRTGDVSLVDLAREYLRKKFNKPGNIFVGVVHRLDRPVGGVVLLARTSKAAARLAEQFRSNRVEKTYHALVEGRVASKQGVLFDSLIKDQQTNVVRRTKERSPGARECSLAYRRLKVLEETTLLEIRPQTGRSHQIRVQLAGAGHPIVGDRKYGSKRRFPDGIALRAVSLCFQHPTQKSPITVEYATPLEDDSGSKRPYNRH
jgi:23S rRNA pseudouridine1911/1915/1917 synthase